ncbi:hypothetical protein [Candidatus Protofrankia californiensis]|uniref:hypothetical protein n=1 Tax=Candidatus Protofrankia californiensis TaxID=1839754 RepID=UPI0010416016|nr:hypothetical protein [Candidatus Protofrankia californiensis]
MSIHQYDPWGDILNKHARRGRGRRPPGVLLVVAAVLVVGFCAGVLLGLPLLHRDTGRSAGGVTDRADVGRSQLTGTTGIR